MGACKIIKRREKKKNGRKNNGFALSGGVRRRYNLLTVTIKNGLRYLHTDKDTLSETQFSLPFWAIFPERSLKGLFSLSLVKDPYP